MADIQKWFPFVLRWEGGLANIKEDLGGLTNMGITIGTWRLLAPRLLGFAGTEETLKKLTRPQWEVIAKRAFWDEVHGDSILHDDIACCVVDIQWHHGAGSIRWVVQPVLNAQFGCNLVVDGIVGPNTLKAINAQEPEKLFIALNQARWNFFLNLIKRRPEQAKFIQGWYNRIADLARRFGRPAPVPAP